MFGYSANLINGLTPPSIPGLFAWYDAADLSTITESSGAVSQWNDKSGNDYHVTQGTGASQPGTGAVTQNGLNVLTFDGGDSLILPAAWYAVANRDGTTFAVSKIDSDLGGPNYMISLTEAAALRWFTRYNTTDGQIWFRHGPAGATGVTNTGNTNTNYQIVTTFTSGTTVSIQVDGDTPVTDTSGVLDSGVDAGAIGYDGTSTFFTGGCAELFNYNRALTADEILSLSFYLSLKWGITLP